jgi:hypothetical protein
MPTPNMSMLRIAYRNPSSISVQGDGGYGGDGGNGSLSIATFGGFTRIQAASIRNNLLSNSMMSKRTNTQSVQSDCSLVDDPNCPNIYCGSDASGNDCIRKYDSVNNIWYWCCP